MNQSSIIAATLLAGFVLYLAAQDRLKVYAAVLWGNTKAPLPSQQSGATALPGVSGGSGGSPGTTSLLGDNPFGDLLGDAGSVAGLLEFIP